MELKIDPKVVPQPDLERILVSGPQAAEIQEHFLLGRAAARQADLIAQSGRSPLQAQRQPAGQPK